MTETTFLLEAEEELNYSAFYYNKQAPGLGFDFLKEIKQSLQEIKRAPERWSEHENQIRKFNTKRFPFSLYYIYEKVEDKVIIIAVAHQKRKPGYWKTRI
jgi:plasmid stabilization system protein ParE